MALILNEPDICGRPPVVFANGILSEIFRECDVRDDEETGGRLAGIYDGEKIMVLAQIGPGPNARRTRTSFFQDGEYQEPIFRALERKLPQICHLGNWHTHHVNGLQTLSQGDVETYKRTVNSQNHAQNYFLAMLVTEKLGASNYRFRNYLFRRGDPNFYEL